MVDDHVTIQRLENREPGSDPDDPYEDVDTADLPDWWRELIIEFEQHGLRPYRPPKFADGVPKYGVVNRIEKRHEVAITFVKPDRTATNWEVRIDDDPVMELDGHRSPWGYSVFEVGSDEFKDRVLDAIT